MLLALDKVADPDLVFKGGRSRIQFSKCGRGSDPDLGFFSRGSDPGKTHPDPQPCFKSFVYIDRNSKSANYAFFNKSYNFLIQLEQM